MARTSVSTEALLAIIRQCPGLRQLNMDDVSGVNDGVMEAVASTCHHLERLTAGGRKCKAHVSDESVRALAVSPCASTLGHISLCGCSAVTTDAIIQLVTSCHGLAKLDVRATHGSSDKLLFWLADRAVKAPTASPARTATPAATPLADTNVSVRQVPHQLPHVGCKAGAEVGIGELAGAGAGVGAGAGAGSAASHSGSAQDDVVSMAEPVGRLVLSQLLVDSSCVSAAARQAIQQACPRLALFLD